MGYGPLTSRTIAGQLRKLLTMIEDAAQHCFPHTAPRADWNRTSAFEHMNALHASLESTLRLARRHSRELRARKGH